MISPLFASFTRLQRSRRWLIALALLSLASMAQADLMLFPTRVVFEGRTRSASVELMNQGNKPETYRLRMVNRRMGPNGEFTAIETPGPGEAFSDGMVVFSPHQVTLQPGTSQTVRILLRKPADLADGEYRSHLQLDRVAEATGGSNVEQLAKAGGTQEIGVVIQALVGASIPVIVRQGQTQAQVKLTQLALMPSGPGQPGGALSMKIERAGNRSVYGDISVSFTTAGGVTLELAKAQGVAVYVPNAERSALLPLTLPGGAPLPAGVLRVAYRERPEAGGKLIADAALTLP